MTANRLLASVAWVPLMAAVAAAQSYNTAPPPPRTVTTAAASEPFGPQWPPPSSLFPGKTGGVRPASGMETPPAAPPPVMTPTAADTLTGPAFQPVPGAVYSPWVGDQYAGGCCGPVGANGPVTYETYFRTGPSLISGGGPLATSLKTFGWNIQAGGRSLLFNQAGDAAWVLDLGLGYTNNRGRGAESPIDILSNSVKFGGVTPGTFTAGVTEMRRTSFNFGVGRDYFLNGPGMVGQAPDYGNFRLGWDVGGRWGTASIDFEPFGDPDGTRRRQNVYHGVYLGGQGTWEKTCGGWTFYMGGRVEWGYYWTNLVPPNDGDFRDVNLLFMLGVRF